MSNKGKRYEIAILIPCTLDLRLDLAIAITLKFKIRDTQYSPIIQAGLFGPLNLRSDSLSMLAFVIVTALVLLSATPKDDE